MYNEKVKRSQLDYQKDNVKQYSLRFIKNTEQSYIDWLEEKENKLGYVKSLIRADMEKNGIVVEDMSNHRVEKARSDLEDALCSPNPALWYLENTGVTSIENARTALSKAKKRYPDIVESIANKRSK